ncbi:hypothetical protein KFV02_00220 [Desulfohalobiaceae bacterium Ax17]|uniref:hypothetical protein n=1 Tax=Desulfovulcanus ferrireducens TaxID=2831190 RepID=UPI00207BBDA6|nr:hypothetical protein [Desulfovulcanus ferrireducens]MBT8762357.1 hypothetical protein [Desulfovulcanus ferrireducens]
MQRNLFSANEFLAGKILRPYGLVQIKNLYFPERSEGMNICPRPESGPGKYLLRASVAQATSGSGREFKNRITIRYIPRTGSKPSV